MWYNNGIATERRLKMTNKQKKATAFALLAAVLYAISSPFSKLLLEEVPAAMMASFLYLGAGVGIFIMGLIKKAAGKKGKEQPLCVFRSHYQSVGYLRFRKSWEHWREVDYEFTFGMCDDCEVWICAFGHILFQLDAEFLFVCHTKLVIFISAT